MSTKWSARVLKFQLSKEISPSTHSNLSINKIVMMMIVIIIIILMIIIMIMIIIIIIKSRLSLIVRVNVVQNRTVVVGAFRSVYCHS